MTVALLGPGREQHRAAWESGGGAVRSSRGYYVVTVSVIGDVAKHGARKLRIQLADVSTEAYWHRWSSTGSSRWTASTCVFREMVYVMLREGERACDVPAVWSLSGRIVSIVVCVSEPGLRSASPLRSPASRLTVELQQLTTAIVRAERGE